MKTLMLLGGSAQQVVAIRMAQKLGHRAVLCDYLDDNPGRLVADRFYQVSTTDREAVLEVARREKIDGVLAYASDPAAPTAAYVAQRLGLPGNPYDSVEILCNKDRFRAFLAAHGFHTPRAKGFDTADIGMAEAAWFQYPVMVKPVDSSGSKGVSLVETPEALGAQMARAMAFSRCGRVIVEEFVKKTGYQVAGDGLSVDGELVFHCFGDDHFDAACGHPFVPVAASFPCSMPPHVQESIRREVQRLISLLGMRTCAYNFDILVDSHLNVNLMEIAPRSGGNYIPQVIRAATGVDLVECAVRGALGESLSLPEQAAPEGFFAYYAVHSKADGVLKRIDIREDAAHKIFENHLLVKPGDAIKSFAGANSTLGILLMRFDGMDEMLDMLANAGTWIEVVLE